MSSSPLAAPTSCSIRSDVWTVPRLLPIVEKLEAHLLMARTKTIHGGNAISTNGALFESVMAVIRKIEES